MSKLLGSKKLILMIAGIALIGGAAAALFMLPMSPLAGSPLGAVLGNAPPAAEASRTPEPHRTSKEANSGPGMMYPMKERIVNLADPGTFHYLKSEIVLEFELPEAKNLKGEAYKKRQEEFTKEMASTRPKLDDILTNVLTSKTTSFLSTPEGKDKLREELKSKLAEAVGEQKLINLYFTQFIIQ